MCLDVWVVQEVLRVFLAYSGNVMIWSPIYHFQTVLRILDAYLVEGMQVIFRVVLALIKMTVPKILTKECHNKRMWLNSLDQLTSQLVEEDRLMKVLAPCEETDIYQTAFDFRLRESKTEELVKISEERVQNANIVEPIAKIYYRPLITDKSSLLGDKFVRWSSFTC